MPGHLDAIVSLHTTMIEHAACEQRLNTIPEWMRDLHEEYSGRKAEIEAVEAEGAAAEQQRRESEAEWADAEAQQKRYQEQLGKVSTQREYGALLKEIDTTKELIAKNEQAAVEAAELKDQSDAKLGELNEAFRELDQRYHAELEKWESEKPAVADEVKHLTARIQELRAAVPRNELVLFDRLVERSSGAALARVQTIKATKGNAMWHCEACSYNVRPQVVVEIRDRGSLNQCDSCKRILYWEDEA